jgi:hypothetical protein
MRPGYECLRIYFECPFESCKCLRMPLRILVNALQIKRLHNACMANCIYTPFQCFTLSPISQPLPIALRMLRMLTNALATLANACKCPCESCERLRLLKKMLQKQWEYDIRQEFRNMFLNYFLFATLHKWQRMLTNTYKCLAITLRSLRIGGELHSY